MVTLKKKNDTMNNNNTSDSDGSLQKKPNRRIGAIAGLFLLLGSFFGFATPVKAEETKDNITLSDKQKDTKDTKVTEDINITLASATATQTTQGFKFESLGYGKVSEKLEKIIQESLELTPDFKTGNWEKRNLLEGTCPLKGDTYNSLSKEERLDIIKEYAKTGLTVSLSDDTITIEDIKNAGLSKTRVLFEISNLHKEMKPYISKINGMEQLKEQNCNIGFIARLSKGFSFNYEVTNPIEQIQEQRKMLLYAAERYIEREIRPEEQASTKVRVAYHLARNYTGYIDNNTDLIIAEYFADMVKVLGGTVNLSDKSNVICSIDEKDYSIHMVYTPNQDLTNILPKTGKDEARKASRISGLISKGLDDIQIIKIASPIGRGKVDLMEYIEMPSGEKSILSDDFRTVDKELGTKVQPLATPTPIPQVPTAAPTKAPEPTKKIEPTNKVEPTKVPAPTATPTIAPTTAPKPTEAPKPTVAPQPTPTPKVEIITEEFDVYKTLDGEVILISPTPSPTPEPTPEPSPTPEVTSTLEPTPTLQPSPTPETVIAAVENNIDGDSQGGNGPNGGSGGDQPEPKKNGTTGVGIGGAGIAIFLAITKVLGMGKHVSKAPKGEMVEGTKVGAKGEVKGRAVGKGAIFRIDKELGINPDGTLAIPLEESIDYQKVNKYFNETDITYDIASFDNDIEINTEIIEENQEENDLSLALTNDEQNME